MPKVTLSTIAAGPGGTAQPGDVYTMSDEQVALLPEGRYELADAPSVAAPPVAADDPEAAALMELKNGELMALAKDNGVTFPRKPNKAQLVAALRARGITVPQGPETAALGGGETAANTEPPKPRQRRRVESPAAE